MSTQFQVNNIADPDVDNAQEPLVTLLELALIEYLDSNNRRVFHIANAQDQLMQQKVRQWLTYQSSHSSKGSKSS